MSAANAPSYDPLGHGRPPAAAPVEPGSGRFQGLARVVGVRLLELAIVVLLLVVLAATIVRLLPGDPAEAILGQNATPDRVAQLRQELDLDRPVLEQVVTALADTFRGDLGESLAQQRPVTDVLTDSFPVTLSIMFGGVMIALVVAVPLGLLPALLRSSALNRVVRTLSVAILAIPPFVIGLYLLLVVAIGWGLAPPGGWGEGWPDNLRYAWLPSLTVSLVIIPQLLRAVQRSAMDVLDEEYVEAARGRGLSELAIVTRHVLPNVLLPVITLVGFEASWLLGGTVVVEAVFGIPGFGEVIQYGVGQRDYPVVVGVTLVAAVTVVTINLLAEVLYAVVDPRVRTGT
jgi:peptide/nickel transport system permease protein